MKRFLTDKIVTVNSLIKELKRKLAINWNYGSPKIMPLMKRPNFRYS